MAVYEQKDTFYQEQKWITQGLVWGTNIYIAT